MSAFGAKVTSLAIPLTINFHNLVEARGPRTDRCLLFVYYRVAVLAQIFFEFGTTGGEIGSRSERAGAEEEGKLLREANLFSPQERVAQQMRYASLLLFTQTFGHFPQLNFLYLAADGHRHLRKNFHIFGKILAGQLLPLKVSDHLGKV